MALTYPAIISFYSKFYRNKHYIPPNFQGVQRSFREAGQTLNNAFSRNREYYKLRRGIFVKFPSFKNFGVVSSLTGLISTT